MKPTAIDLFAGVGGLSLGFELAGFEVLVANEFDKAIAESYSLNHPKTEMIEADIATLPIDETFQEYKGKITAVIGGPPCQGFSQKGQRKSVNDERNFLFKQYVQVVDYVRPKYFVMENVPNLLTTENGYFRTEITNLFTSLGYEISCGVLCAADFGIPQNRHRSCFIGTLEGGAVSLPKPRKSTVTIWDAISDLDYLESGEGKEVQDYRFAPQTKYQEKLRSGSKKLFNHVATSHSDITLERLALIPPNHGKDKLPEEHLTKSIYSGTWCRMKKDGIARTITTRYDTPSSGEFTHPVLNRAITTREAARIQSFPDTFRFYGNKSSQMKQVGNAVPPLLARAIAEQLLADLRDRK